MRADLKRYQFTCISSMSFILERAFPSQKRQKQVRRIGKRETINHAIIAQEYTKHPSYGHIRLKSFAKRSWQWWNPYVSFDGIVHHQGPPQHESILQRQYTVIQTCIWTSLKRNLSIEEEVVLSRSGDDDRVSDSFPPKEAQWQWKQFIANSSSRWGTRNRRSHSNVSQHRPRCSRHADMEKIRFHDVDRHREGRFGLLLSVSTWRIKTRPG